MNAVDAFDRSVLVPSIARRAVDVARDARTPSDDGAEHLVRLAMGRRDSLVAALAELRMHAASADVACAELLLTRAIELADPERKGGTRDARA